MAGFLGGAGDRLLSLAERSLPPGITDVETLHRTRAAVAQTWLGVFFTTLFGSLYAVSGSPWSGASILLITAGLLAVPFAIRRGTSVSAIGNTLVCLTWLATFVVASRSGGFTSPAVVWAFLFPLATYAVCGRRSAVVWSILSGLQIGLFFVAEVAGVTFPQDFSPRILSVLRVSGYAGVIATILLLLSVIEAARRAAFDAIDAENRTRERARILDDMHDGVGSQLLGLVIQLRGGTIDPPAMIAALESCLDDLRLIVASLDAGHDDFELALGELRARLEPRCAAAQIELRWHLNLDAAARPDSASAMHALRSLQEMLTNALRHAATARIDVHVGARDGDTSVLEVSVRDYGSGFDPLARSRSGRGLKSLKTRARKLGGNFEIVPADPGAIARLQFRVGAPETRGG